MTKFNVKTFSAALVAGLAFWSFHTCADQPPAGVDWVLTGDSVALDRSTSYLANGYAQAAIRHANRVLHRNSTPLEKLIANHNLCIAWNVRAEPQAAEPFCQTAQTLPIPKLELQQIKPGLYRIKQAPNAEDQPQLLDTVLTANLAAVTGDEPSRIVAAAIADEDGS
jgi:hypothetical protein